MPLIITIRFAVDGGLLPADEPACVNPSINTPVGSQSTGSWESGKIVWGPAPGILKSIVSGIPGVIRLAEFIAHLRLPGLLSSGAVLITV